MEKPVPSPYPLIPNEEVTREDVEKIALMLEEMIEAIEEALDGLE